MNAPWQPFPYALAQAQTGYIAAPSMLNSADGTTHPVGTGPFVFKEWIPNSHFTPLPIPALLAQGPAVPQFDHLQADHRSFGEEQRTADGHGRHHAHQYATAEILAFRNNKQWAYVDNSGAILGQPDVNCVMLNTSNAQQYAKVIDHNVNTPMSGMFLRGSPYYSPTAYPAPDPKGAANLVKQIQQQTGKPVSFALTATNNSEVERAAQFLQQEWSQAGMKVTINVQEQAALINDALAGKYQAVTWRQFGAVVPDLNYIWWSTTTASGPLSLDMARNSDPRIGECPCLRRSGRPDQGLSESQSAPG
jgi:peptide/nickel transport system substrate-binding protein